jgi:hypothetical protein
MKIIHNFNQSLKYERSHTENADKFYRDVLGATEIRRFSSDNDEDMYYQKQDIDVELVIREKNYGISEKFREKNFGDLYIEFFSMYPDVPGWLDTGSPDAIMYFTPENAYWISHRSLKYFYDNTLAPLIKKEWFEEIYKSGEAIKIKQINVEDKIYKISIIQAHNHNKVSWKTIGISIPFQWLEDANVRFKRFNSLG